MGDEANWPDALADLDPAKLARYLSGESDAAEAASLRRWIEATRERRDAVAGLGAIWHAAHEVKPAWDVERALSDVTQRRAERHRASFEPDPQAVFTVPRQRTTRSMRWWAVAAFVLAFAVYATSRLLSARGAGHVEQLASKVYETSNGERATITLSDGTRVTLAPASRLRLHSGYGGKSRDVQLAGEAYFDVQHDSTRPFRVYTSRGVAQDLGTAFVVTAYDDVHVLRVVVASGRVSLGSLVLNAGDLGELNESGGLEVRHHVDIAQALDWTNGRLVADGMPLGEVAARLSRWYATDVRLGDSTLANRRVTATFENESVTEAIDALALSLHLRVERRDGVVTLYSFKNSDHGQ